MSDLFLSLFSSLRHAGGDRAAPYCHRRGRRVACVANEDGRDHGPAFGRLIKRPFVGESKTFAPRMHR